MYVNLTDWASEVRQACSDSNRTVQDLSKEIGHSCTTLTNLLSGRVVKGNYIEIAKKINGVLGIENLPEEPTLPSKEWCAAVRAEMFLRKLTIKRVSEKIGFSRDRLSLVLNGHSLDWPIIDKVNSLLDIDVSVVSASDS